LATVDEVADRGSFGVDLVTEDEELVFIFKSRTPLPRLSFVSAEFGRVGSGVEGRGCRAARDGEAGFSALAAGTTGVAARSIVLGVSRSAELAGADGTDDELGIFINGVVPGELEWFDIMAVDRGPEVESDVIEDRVKLGSGVNLEP
jgi:hypothetical protein